MNVHGLNAALSQALGLPKNTARAVLTLEAGELPKLRVEVLCMDERGFVTLSSTLEGTVADRVRSVQFMLRLEPFHDQPYQGGDV